MTFKYYINKYKYSIKKILKRQFIIIIPKKYATLIFYLKKSFTELPLTDTTILIFDIFETQKFI